MSGDGAATGRRWWRVALAVVTVVVAGAIGWLAVGDGVRPGALDALPDDVEIVVVGDVHVIHASSAPAVGVVFLPGWRIEREAYVPVLADLVAAADRDGLDVAVAVPSVPLNTAFLDRSRADDARAAASSVVHEPTAGWVLGGHSLGGLIGATIIEEQPESWVGWLSWASLVPRAVELTSTGVPALVVAGGADDVVPAAQARESLSRLPDSASFAVVEEMTHQQFGRYAPSAPTDGPGSDEETLTRLVEVTTDWLGHVAGSRRP